MRFFFLKLIAFLLSVALTILCLIFLFTNHGDNLVQFVPAEAEAYFHANTRDILKLPPNQLATYLAWLSDKSGLPAQAWQNVLTELNNEISIFTINGQVFGIVKSTSRTQALIRTNQITAANQGKALIFPTLTVSNARLIDNTWFQATRRKIVFSDFVLYLKKLHGNIFPFPALATEKPLAAFGGVADGVLKLKVKGDVGQTINDKQIPQLTNLPDNFNFYFRNLNTSSMTQKAEYTAENFQFNLLKLINGTIEFLDTDSGFTLFAKAADNPLPELQNKIAGLLALTEPTKQEKVLPDGTIAVQRIVDPGAWQFKETILDDQPVWTLANTNQENSLSIIQRAGLYSIKQDSKASNPNWTISADIFNKCSKFRNKSSTLINLKNISPQATLHNLFLINKSANKLLVCID